MAWNRIDRWTRDSCSAVPLGTAPRLSEAERAEYDRLAAWFLAWQPPSEEYQISLGVWSTDPIRSHAYVCECIRDGCVGQVQRSVLAHLRAHWVLFGGK